MKNLFRADMRRILRAKSLYICSVLSILWILWGILREIINQGENATGYISGVTKSLGSGLEALLIVFPVFYAVFAHELSSKSMQCVLGHGITRDKLVLTKFLDAAALIVGIYLVITVVVLGCADSSLGISDRQMRQLVIFVWLRGLRHFGYIVFSAAIMFLANSASAGIVACVAFSFVFQLVFELIEIFTGYSVSDYTFDGMLDWAYDAIEAGAFPWQLVPAVGYMAAAVIVTILFFRRKEFEF